MRVDYLSADKWTELAENAHLVVFNERRRSEMNRIDYALMTIGDDGVPLSYVTVREFDQDSVYWQYGGAFPGTRGTTRTIRCYKAFIDWTMAQYKRITTLVENTNKVYLKMALTCGFLPIGIRNFHGTVLLELLLEGGNDVATIGNGSSRIIDGHGATGPSAEGSGLRADAQVG